MTEHKIKKQKKYFIWEFLNFSKVKILTVVKIKKGFRSSIGCSLKKLKSSHLLAPLTSTPIKGTNIKRATDTAKQIIEILKRFC